LRSCATFDVGKIGRRNSSFLQSKRVSEKTDDHPSRRKSNNEQSIPGAHSSTNFSSGSSPAPPDRTLIVGSSPASSSTSRNIGRSSINSQSNGDSRQSRDYSQTNGDPCHPRDYSPTNGDPCQTRDYSRRTRHDPDGTSGEAMETDFGVTARRVAHGSNTNSISNKRSSGSFIVKKPPSFYEKTPPKPPPRSTSWIESVFTTMFGSVEFCIFGFTDFF